IRAISRLRRLAGISTVSCAAMIPLRIRVRKSAMGSVMLMGDLPARLRHAGDVALVRQLAQAQAAEPELPVHRARAPAATTTRVRARLVLGRPLRGDDLGCLCHVSLCYAATGSASVSKWPGRPSRANGMPS